MAQICLEQRVEASERRCLSEQNADDSDLISAHDKNKAIIDSSTFFILVGKIKIN
jgi:hypothetical protein